MRRLYTPLPCCSNELIYFITKIQKESFPTYSNRKHLCNQYCYLHLSRIKVKIKNSNAYSIFKTQPLKSEVLVLVPWLGRGPGCGLLF